MHGANRGFVSVIIGINDRDSSGPKQYVLKEVIGRHGGYDNSTKVADIFKTTSEHTGQLTIKSVDKRQKIVEGVFYFQAYNPVQDTLVHVTQGKFRLKYTDY